MKWELGLDGVMRIITNGFLKGEWGVVPHNNPYIRSCMVTGSQSERERDISIYRYIYIDR